MANKGFAYYIDVDGSIVPSLLAFGVFVVPEFTPGETEDENLAKVRAGQGVRLSMGQLRNVTALQTGKNLTGLAATALSASAIRISWNRFPLAFSYEIQRSTDNITFTPWQFVNQPLLTNPTTDRTGLSQSTMEYYQVRARNALGTAISLWTKTSATTLIGLETASGTVTNTLLAAITAMGYNATLNFDVLNFLISYSEDIEVQISDAGGLVVGTILGGNAGKFNLAGDTWLGYTGRIRLDRNVAGVDGIQPAHTYTVKIRTVANRNLVFVYSWTPPPVTSTAAVTLDLPVAPGTDTTPLIRVFAGPMTWTRTVADPTPTFNLPANRQLVFNLTPDPPEYVQGGVFANDHFGDQTLYNPDGSIRHHAYLREWPGKDFSIFITYDNYLRNQGEFNRRVMYENIRATSDEVNAKYFLRFSCGRPYSDADPLMPLGAVARFHTGAVALNNGAMSLRLDLLKAFIAGGESDTTNPWYYVKRYVRGLINDFKPHILSGRCQYVSTTLNSRQEDGYTYDFVYQNGSRTDNVLIGDYSAGAIADFKATMGVTQNPPTPLNYQQSDAFAGTVGRKWFIYRQQMYLMFKGWLRDQMRAVVPGVLTGNDFGLFFGGEGASSGVSNFATFNAGVDVVKFNPDYFGVASYLIDFVRSNAPAGARIDVELDTNAIIDRPFESNAAPRSVNEVADVIGAYYARGAGSICFGQLANGYFTQTVAIANAIINRGYLNSPVSIIPRPDADHRTAVTAEEVFTSPLSLGQDRWFQKGGTATPTEVKIIDNLAY